MKIKTVDTNKEFELTEEPLQHNKPYVCSEDGINWYYMKEWNNTFKSEGGKHPLELLNSKIIRKLIKDLND